MARNNMRILCKSIFKDGAQTTRCQLTQKWIEMINQLEKRKKASTKKA